MKDLRSKLGGTLFSMLVLATGSSALLQAGCAGDEPFVEQKVSRELRDSVKSGKVRDVVVMLRDDVVADPDQILSAAERQELVNARRDNLAAVREAALADMPTSGIKVTAALGHLPMLIAEIDSVEALDQLALMPEVAQVVADGRHELGDVHGAAKDALATFDASERAVAVLDNGVKHAAVIASAELAVDDGAVDADGRGSAMAADLVAAVPSAKIVALDVVGADGKARTSDLLRAMDWVAGHQGEHDIAGVAVALDPSDSSPARAAVDQAMAVTSDLGLPSIIAKQSRSQLNPASGAFGGGQFVRGGGIVANAAPTAGTVTIASGASFTKTASVALQLTCTFGGTACTAATAQMCISNNGICSTWVAYAASKAHTLAAPDGSKTVTVFFRETSSGLQMSGSATDTITLDVTKPVEGSFTAQRASSSSNLLSWVGFSDATAGLDVYRIAYTANTTGVTTPPAAAACSATPSAGATSGTIEVASTAVTYTHSSLTAGSRYNYRFCARDRALNYSAGKTGFAYPSSSTTPPGSGSVVVASGAESSAGPTASVALSATASGGGAPSKMCVGIAPTCTAFVTYNTSATVTLGTTSGLKTVYAFFQDASGNTNKAPFVDSIMLDRTVPVNGAVGRSQSGSNIVLNWAGFTDLHTNVANYLVVRSAANGAAPTASCTGADISSATTGLSHTDAGSNLTDGAAYIYRVCAVDAHGNKSTGAVTTAITYTAP